LKAVLFQGGLYCFFARGNDGDQHSTALTPDARSEDVPTEPIYRLSVAQYHAMARTGILTDDDPVEEQIEGDTEPSGPRKRRESRRRQDHRPSDAIPLVIDGIEVGRIPARELLP
jgi:hypothetical protein